MYVWHCMALKKFQLMMVRTINRLREFDPILNKLQLYFTRNFDRENKSMYPASTMDNGARYCLKLRLSERIYEARLSAVTVNYNIICDHDVSENIQ